MKRLAWVKSWSQSASYERLEFWLLLEGAQQNREALAWEHTDLDPTDLGSGYVTLGRLNNLATYAVSLRNHTKP